MAGAFQFGAPAPAPAFGAGFGGFGAAPAFGLVPGEKKKELNTVLVPNQPSEFNMLASYCHSKNFTIQMQQGAWAKNAYHEAAVVMVGGSSRCADAKQLAEYVQEGGCVIAHSYCCTQNYANNSVGGVFSDLHPIAFGNQQNFNHQNQKIEVIKENSSEIFPDLMVDVDANGIMPPMGISYRGMNAKVKKGAVRLLDYNDGSSFVAYNRVGDGLVVTVNVNFCQAYVTQFPTNFWNLLRNIISACVDFRNDLHLSLDECFLKFEEFEKQKNFVQCVTVVSSVNKRFNSVKKNLELINAEIAELQAEQEILEKDYQTGAKMLKDLTNRIKTLREIHECNCENWSSEEVGQWLTSLQPSWSTYADAFKQNEVSGDLLVDLSDGELKTLGVAKLRDRRKILKAIRSLVEGKEGMATTGGKAEEDV